jgi:hypothetical protein
MDSKEAKTKNEDEIQTVGKSMQFSQVKRFEQ